MKVREPIGEEPIADACALLSAFVFGNFTAGQMLLDAFNDDTTDHLVRLVAALAATAAGCIGSISRFSGVDRGTVMEEMCRLLRET